MNIQCFGEEGACQYLTLKNVVGLLAIGTVVVALIPMGIEAEALCVARAQALPIPQISQLSAIMLIAAGALGLFALVLERYEGECEWHPLEMRPAFTLISLTLLVTGILALAQGITYTQAMIPQVVCAGLCYPCSYSQP